MPANVLDDINPKEIGRRLREARERQRLTQAEAANIIDTSRTTMVAIEKGKRQVRPGELISLARAYGRPVSDFVRSRPSVRSFQVQFRAARVRSAQENEEIEPVIEAWQGLCESYLELEEALNAPLPRAYPPEHEISWFPTEVMAESIAASERNRLGLGDGPVGRLRDVLEQEVGLRVFYLPMPPKFSEIYAYDDRLGGCLAINAHHPVERQRWSLSHGYLHFLAHRRNPVFHYEGQYDRWPESERLADAFAMHFLLPTSSVSRHFAAFKRDGKFTPADLLTLADYYGVGVETLVRRMEGLKLLPTGTWESLKSRGFKVREAQTQFSIEARERERVDKYPVYYKHLAIEALDDGSITEGRFAELLGVDRVAARQIAAVLRQRSSGIEDGSTEIDLSLREASVGEV